MKKLLVGIVFLIVLAAGFIAFKMLQPIPEGLDLRIEKPSDAGLYVVSFQQETGEASVGPIVPFLVGLKDINGIPIEGVTISVDGGMPQHGHGLPTQPKQTEMVSPGTYRVDGVKFSMTGWWDFRLKIEAPGGEDTVTFNVVLE